MKIKNDLMLRKVGGQWIIVPMGERLAEYNGMMKLSESGAFLWKLLEQDITREQLLECFLEEYDADAAEAARDVDEFIGKLSDAHVLED
jgi:hypothetical protein